MMNQPNQPSNRRERGSVLVVILVLVGAVFAAWQAGLFERFMGGDEVEAIEGAPVRRGPLRISEVVRGNLEAKNSAVLRSELDGRATILFLEEEGSTVEKGQLICELDVSELEDELVRQEIEVKNAEANFTKAREQYDIQVIQNESDIASAELALELAQLDLEKYRGETESQAALAVDGAATEPAESAVPEDVEDLGGGEWANELASARETVFLREEDLNQAAREFDASQELWDLNFLSKNEYDGAFLAKQRAEIQLDQAKRSLKLLEEYGNRRKLAELNAAVATCERDIEKVEKQASARLADFEAARESAKYVLERERQQLEEMKGQVDKAKIYAPVDGLLVYGRERSRWGDGDVVQEGTEVRERQEIASIPRPGGMTIEASIHETKLKKVNVGQPCKVSIEAIPGKVFDGRVDFVAVMADSGGWRSDPNQRMYKADIVLLEATSEMRPGMSASVEILIEDIEDAHYVPRQCVFLDGDETIVFVIEKGEVERRPVEIGLDNTKWVAIESGLKEGETVALAPPADFQPKASSPVDGSFGEQGEDDGEGGERRGPGAAGQGGQGGPGRGDRSGMRPGGGQRPGGGERPSGGQRPSGGGERLGDAGDSAKPGAASEAASEPAPEASTAAEE